MRIQLLFAALLASAPLALVAQSAPQPPMTFEVTSIHPDPAGNTAPSDRQVLPGGRFVATGTSVRTLLRIAFGTDDNRISGVPAWVDNETFQISATVAGHADITTPEQFQQLLLSLLEDRFQLKFHREQQEAGVYWLQVDKPGKLGPSLKPGTAGAQPTMSSSSNGIKASLSVTDSSMADIAAGLRRQAGRQVEDHTGLPGRYSFHIEWSPNESPDSTIPSLFTVLREQLGLKLQPAKGPVDIIAIDQIAHPSPN